MTPTTKILLLAAILLFIMLVISVYLLYKEINKNEELIRQKNFIEMDRERWKESYEELNNLYNDLKSEIKKWK